MGKRAGLKIVSGLLILCLIVFVGLGLFLSKGKTLSERHQPYAYSEGFDFEAGSFTDYISYAQNHLRLGKVVTPSAELIRNASPFLLEPDSSCAKEDGKYLNGIVLSHGLIASPYSMISIGEYFQSRCFYVLAILLPDHVVRPGDFVGTHWEEWAQVQAFAIQALEQKVENIFLSGHSVGATLALYGAGTNSTIDGLILFTPALQITATAKYAKYLRPFAAFFPKAAWFEIRQDKSDYRYESITFSAAEETYALIQATEKALVQNPLSIPVFTVASVQDNTVSTEATLGFMKKQVHRASTTLLYSQHPLPEQESVKVYRSYVPEQGVLSVSHLGIMLPDSHQEYGRDGAYRSCGHYYAQEEALAGCQAGQRDYYGEVTEENLQEGLVERIAFNPFYDDLLSEIEGFLDSL